MQAIAVLDFVSISACMGSSCFQQAQAWRCALIKVPSTKQAYSMRQPEIMAALRWRGFSVLPVRAATGRGWRTLPRAGRRPPSSSVRLLFGCRILSLP